MHLGSGHLAAHVQREGARVAHRDVAARFLVGQQRPARVAIARCHRHRNGQPHAALLKRQQLPIAVADHRLLAGQQVAQAHREQAIARLLEQDGGVALFQRRLVGLDRLALALHDARQGATADRHLQRQQHRLHRQRKGVDRLNGLGLGVAVVLLHRELQQGPLDHARERNALQRHRQTRQRLQHGHCFNAHRRSPG